MVRFWPPARSVMATAALLPAVLSPALPAMCKTIGAWPRSIGLGTRAGRAHLEGRVGDEARARDFRHGLL